MATREGRCKNCGSIILVDTKKDQAHCLFCNCVFPKDEAFAILENPDQYTFPNDPQPEYKGPQLSPTAKGGVVSFSNTPVKSTVKKGNTARANEVEPYQVTQKKIPDLRMKPKLRLLISIGCLVLVGIFLAVTIPLKMQREARKESITQALASHLEKLPSVEKTSLTVGKDFDIQRNDNSLVTIVLPEAQKEDVVQLFKDFCQIRADELSLEQTDIKHTVNNVTLKVLTNSGGYQIDRPADLEDATLEAAIKETK